MAKIAGPVDWICQLSQPLHRQYRVTILTCAKPHVTGGACCAAVPLTVVYRPAVLPLYGTVVGNLVRDLTDTFSSRSVSFIVHRPALFVVHTSATCSAIQSAANTRHVPYSTITFLTTKIYVAENENDVSYIRTVLEVFVLYSIISSDFAWIRNSRAAYIDR